MQKLSAHDTRQEAGIAHDAPNIHDAHNSGNAQAAQQGDAPTGEESVAPRRLPLLAGEHTGHVISNPHVPLLTAENGQQTAIWLQSTTLELRHVQALAPDESLVAVAADLSYGMTDTGRLVIF